MFLQLPLLWVSSSRCRFFFSGKNMYFFYALPCCSTFLTPLFNAKVTPVDLALRTISPVDPDYGTCPPDLPTLRPVSSKSFPQWQCIANLNWGSAQCDLCHGGFCRPVSCHNKVFPQWQCIANLNWGSAQCGLCHGGFCRPVSCHKVFDRYWSVARAKYSTTAT